MTSQTVSVVNQLGMHARAAAKFVHLATRFQARVKVARDQREMDGKSIMGILLLAAATGSVLTLSADGEEYGEERIVNTVQASGTSDPQQMLQSLFNDIREFTKGAAQSDDITALVLRYGA